jgi:hypothetical protein
MKCRRRAVAARRPPIISLTCPAEQSQWEEAMNDRTTKRSAPSTSGRDFVRTKCDWLDCVRRDPALTPFAVRVAAELASFVNRKTGLAWPAHETIAERLGASRSGVKKAIRRLVLAGYLEVKEGRGRTHSNHYRLRQKKGPSQDRFRGASDEVPREKTVLARPEKGPGQARKGSQPGPQNPFNNPLKNPCTANGEEGNLAGALATAPPGGALARRPDSEQVQAGTIVVERDGGGSLSALAQVNQRVERQRALKEIADIVGWENVAALLEGRADDLCDRWIAKKLQPEGLRAEFGYSAPAAAATPAAEVGKFTDDGVAEKAAGRKKPSDCTRGDLQTLFEERAGNSGHATCEDSSRAD